AVARSFPEAFLRKERLLPLKRDGGSLTAATSDIGNLAGIDELRRHSNSFVTLVAAPADQILRYLDQVFGKAADPARRQSRRRWDNPQADDPESEANQRPAARVVEDLLKRAIHDGVSDIHIEPHESAIVTRFRHDGLLHAGPVLPRSIYSAVLTRLKILANLNIAENRLPQDGRILHEIDSRRLDLRISFFPTVYGENVAIRVLDRTRSFGLDTLGLPPEDLVRFRRCCHRPNGLILVTGPTGSGKTTTLYSALSEISSVEKNIMTLEDPVEYELPAVRQSQVNPRAGFTFATGLRAILRHDPDIILVGEMRDTETVEIAIRSAMTGHLVFSTLHTNDALGAIPRLTDMGVAPYLIASSLAAVLAQRLVRVICPACKTSITPVDAGADRLGEAARLLTAAFVGKGCASCGGTGYRGRSGIFEFLVLTPEMQRLIAERSDMDALKRKTMEGAMVPMFTDALRKVASGVTTVDEVVRAVFSEASE
ncbi:MAG: GspE/PulE family protein, partial [Acidobacteriota bacterium]|nr:GspE/PulE family protein [Acidobacteriota bacterium]